MERNRIILALQKNKTGFQEATQFLKNCLGGIPPSLFQFQAIDIFVSLYECQMKKDKAVCISSFPNTVSHKSDAKKDDVKSPKCSENK